MKPFLKSVAEYLYHNHTGELHTIAVVFPNKRARIFLNRYLSEIADKPVFAPKYYTITEYMQEISEQTVSDQLTLLFILYEVYVSVTNSEESFDDFLFYCEMLMGDFDDIDKYLVDAEMLFRNLADLKDMDAYYDYLDDTQLRAIKQFWEAFLESKPSPEKESFSSIWEVLHKIYKEFNKVLYEKDIASEGSAYRKAISDLENSLKQAPGKAVMFVGFNALNTCEKRLFAYLKNQNKAQFFWDFDDYYLSRKSFHEAAYFLGDLVKKYPSPTGFSFETDLASKTRNIKVLDITTNTGQAKILPEIIGELPIDWKSKSVKTAIALADETLLMPVLSALPIDVKEVNISMGYPLKETSVYTLAGILLDLQVNKRVLKDGRIQFYHKDVNRILQNGLIGSTNNNATEKLIEDIKKLNLVYVDSTLLEFNSDLLSAIFSPTIKADNFVGYLISILEKIPAILTDHDNQAQLIEGEAAFRIVTRLQRIKDILLETKIEYSFKSLVRLVGKILQGATVPFSGEPLSGMQIMGILETRILDFDNLIILSMNEGIFPKSGHVPSFIPYNLRKGFGLPTVEHQDAIFAYYFYRLIQRTKNVTLVYTSSVQDSKSGEPSRFIQQLTYEQEFNVDHQTIAYRIHPLKTKKVEVLKSADTRKVLLDKYTGDRAQLLSPSAINSYLNCQLKFYYRYIAGLKEPESVLEEVEANTLGSILHKAMEILYTLPAKKIIDKNDLTSILNNKDVINEAVLNAFWSEYLAPDKEFPGVNKVSITGKNILVKEVISKYIVSIINFDLKNTPFEILALEGKYNKEFKLLNDTRINTGGIIDRLDKFDGKVRVLDYKTGKLKNSFFNIEELFHGDSTQRNDAAFQTLLYALVVSSSHPEDIIEPGLYFVRNMRDKNYNYQLNMKQSKRKLNTISEVKEEFEQHLIGILNDIFSSEGRYVQTEDDKHCAYCAYKNLCAR